MKERAEYLNHKNWQEFQKNNGMWEQQSQGFYCYIPTDKEEETDLLNSDKETNINTTQDFKVALETNKKYAIQLMEVKKNCDSFVKIFKKGELIKETYKDFR